MAAPITCPGGTWTGIGTGAVTFQLVTTTDIMVESAASAPGDGADVGVLFPYRLTLIPQTVGDSASSNTIYIRPQNASTAAIVRKFG